MNRTKYFFLLLAALSLSAMAEQPSGILEQITGTVLIDRGNGFTPARNGSPVLEGDRLLLLENTKAVLLQSHGCLYRLQENSMLVVQKTNPSFCGDAMRTISGAVFAQAIGLEEVEIINDAGKQGFGAIGSEDPVKVTPSADSTQELNVSEEQPANQESLEASIEAEEVASETSASTVASEESVVVSETPKNSLGLSKKALGGILGGAGVVVLALVGGGGGGNNPPVSPQ